MCTPREVAAAAGAAVLAGVAALGPRSSPPAGSTAARPPASSPEAASLEGSAAFPPGAADVIRFVLQRLAAVSAAAVELSAAAQVPRHLRPPSRGDVLAFLPGAPTLLDVCVTHPLAPSVVGRAAASGGAAARAAESAKRRKYDRLGTGATAFVPLAHETFGRLGPAAFRFLNKVADGAASSGAVSRRVFLRNSLRRLSCAMCRAVVRQVRASAPLMARLVGKPVLAGLGVPTDDLLPLVGRAAAV